MSDSSVQQSVPKPKEDPEALVLRGRPRPAVRFRRGLIAGATGAVAAALVALSWFALEPPSLRRAEAPIDADEPGAQARPDALANAPGSYGDVPRLGPPLPGDLGRPILEQQRSLGSADANAANLPIADQQQSAADLERQQMRAAREAARSSAVLVELQAPPSPTSPESSRPDSPAADEPVPTAAARANPKEGPAMADSSAGGLDPHELRRPASRWALSAGTIIPASLVTGLDSDLPGTVVAQVSQNVRDSATGRTVLIPQGARLIGSYDHRIAYGQRRALLVWTRIVFPDGSSVGLDNMPATDSSGYSGLEDKVDSHTWRLLKGIALSTLLGVSTQLSLGGDGDLVRAASRPSRMPRTPATESQVATSTSSQRSGFAPAGPCGCCSTRTWS